MRNHAHARAGDGWGSPGTKEEIGGNRRAARRYDLGLVLRWSLLDRGKPTDWGTGWTVNFSSGGILFQAGCKLPIGFKVRLSIAWPIQLRDVPLQLSVIGRIVRSDGDRVAVRMVQHEFRTAPVQQEGPHDWAAATHAALPSRTVGSPLPRCPRSRVAASF